MICPAFAALALVAAAAAAPAMAQDSPNLSAKFMTCYARAGSSIVQRGVCSQAEVGKQDDRLNKAYQQVMGQMSHDPAAKAALRTQERAWIKERDYSCKINSETIDDGCVVMKTASRADELESRIHF